MMKSALFLLIISLALTANAQSYLISFAGLGDTNTVSMVKVENLTADTSITLNGLDILRLTGSTDINQVMNIQSSDINIYPNPMTEITTMEFYPPVAGNAVIAILDMSGRFLSKTQTYLDKSLQVFRLSGFNNGIYLMTVRGNGYQISGKLLCAGQSNGKISIERVNNNIQAVNDNPSKMEMKGPKGIVDMPYQTGDRLKFTGISGKYSTVITDIPTKDKTITFSFTNCTDADKNNYPVVEIGAQVWMAENLKTTRYSNGDLILTTTPATKDISDETTPKYQWAYDGNESNVATYGRLYTGYAVTDSRNVCPKGWHIPTDIELETLKSYLGVESNAGEKLKETGTTHWQSPNSGATNETGFSAIPGGGRNYSSFYSLHVSCYYLSSTQNPYNLDWVWGQGMYYNSSVLLRGGLMKPFGHSARCLKGQEIFLPVVTTDTITNITSTTAIGGGRVTDEGSSIVISRGVCWSTGTTPTIDDMKITSGDGTGSFISNITNLDGGKTYYVRAYATNGEGTGYGIILSFTTLGNAPAATTQLATDVDTTSATLNGVVNANYLSSTVIFEYGTTADYGQTITAAQSPVSGNSNTNVTAEISGLAAGTIYHYRVNSVNSLGTTNGNDISFTTLGQIPTVSTLKATDIAANSAKLNGTVNTNYLSTKIIFEYGTTTTYGDTIKATQSPISGDSTYNVSANLDGLLNGTTYHYRVIATNSLGTVYGSDETFSTFGYITLLSQDFNSLTTKYTDVNALPGWMTYSQAGKETWYSNNSTSQDPWIQTTSYNSKQASVITWMIAPPINLVTSGKPFISFESADGYDNGATLELFASTDYTGSVIPGASTWTKLSFTLPPSTASGYSGFISSGKVDLSAFIGSTVYIAWVYKGADPSGTNNDNTTTWGIDNINITVE